MDRAQIAAADLLQRATELSLAEVADRLARVRDILEFLSAATPPLAEEMPLLDPAGPLPAFEDRVRFIAAALRTYGQWEPLVRRFAALAER